jgi:hypothetical protein
MIPGSRTLLERSLSLAAVDMCLQARSRVSQWDQLEENLKNLDASGYQQFLEDSEVHQDLFSLLDSILSTKEHYRRLLQYRGEQAQLLVNALQSVSSPFHI